MTMPNERTRALRWGYEVLQQICEDHSVTGDQRSEAAELLLAYPPPAEVALWIQEDVASIPLPAAIAIERMSELLQIISSVRLIWMPSAVKRVLARVMAVFGVSTI